MPGICGWIFVRRLEQGSATWYPGNDNLYGTSSYGDSSNNLAPWAIPFDKIPYDEYLFTTNNFDYYLYLQKSVIVPHVLLEGTMEANIRSSKTPDASGTSQIYNRI